MDNLKAQLHNLLSKLLEEIALRSEKQEYRNEEEANPQNELSGIKCRELLEMYAGNFSEKEKMLVQVAFNGELETEMTGQQLKSRINRTMQEINMDVNQFNIPNEQLPKTISKTVKVKPASVTKKPEQNVPSVESHPEYYRVDHEICHKLFQYYKHLAVGMPKEGSFNFSEKEHYKSTMNYHKILEIFKDSKLNLQIHQKLLILRSIKKFCFNQNFINEEQFIKVFKIIVHGLGYKQQIFYQFIKKKQFEKLHRGNKLERDDNQLGCKKNKQMDNKLYRRNYRFRTDNSAIAYKSVKNVTDDSFEVNNSNVSNISKKRISGYSGKKVTSKQPVASHSSYLVKAMENQKISKITWESLFNMKENSMHNYIVIPSFVRNAHVDQL